MQIYPTDLTDFGGVGEDFIRVIRVLFDTNKKRVNTFLGGLHVWGAGYVRGVNR